MPWYPKARRRLVARFNKRMARPVRINYHTAVTNSNTLFSWFNVWGRATSHFYVDKAGNWEQYVDTSRKAAADLQGNSDTISIESWDGYPKGAPGYWKHNSDVPPWTPAQMTALVEITQWILSTHPSIPAKIAADSRPGRSSHGLSWHRLGIDPYRKSGGLKYSNARGKICPGNRRVAQVPEILARATGGPAARPLPPPKPVRDVTEIQVALAVLGKYDLGPNLEYLDGKYGPATIAATVAYQTGKKSLAPDGDWGKATENYFKENDMSKLVDQIAHATWAYIYPNDTRNYGYILRNTYANTQKAAANQSGLLKAIEQLAGGKPVDLKAITAAAERGAAAAFTGEDLAKAVGEALAEALPEQNTAALSRAVVEGIGARFYSTEEDN